MTLAWPPRATRFYALPPDRHIIGGNAMLGGRALDWLLDITKGAGDREQDYREADALATALSPGAEGVTFLPFLAGQVAPERRPAAAGAFAGLRLGHGPAALYRAVFEGTAFAGGGRRRSGRRLVRSTQPNSPHRRRRRKPALETDPGRRAEQRRGGDRRCR